MNLIIYQLSSHNSRDSNELIIRKRINHWFLISIKRKIKKKIKIYIQRLLIRKTTHLSFIDFTILVYVLGKKSKNW